MAARSWSPKKTEAVEKGGASRVEELPKAMVRRMVKEKLSELSGDGDINLYWDAFLAFSERARIFIHCLSSTYVCGYRRVHDICKESRRQVVNAEDVLTAIEELRKKNEGKAKKSQASKPMESNKRNSEVESSEAVKRRRKAAKSMTPEMKMGPRKGMRKVN